MAKYTIWDIPSGTLLLGTDDESSAKRILQTLLDSNGAVILQELVLGIEQSPRAMQPESVTGEAIARALHLSMPETSRIA